MRFYNQTKSSILIIFLLVWINTNALATPADQNFDSLSDGLVDSPYTLNGVIYSQNLSTKIASYHEDNHYIIGGANDGGASDQLLIFNTNSGVQPNDEGAGAAIFKIATVDGGEFKMVSMQIDAGNTETTNGYLHTFTITGYRDGVSIISDTIDVGNSDTTNSVSFTWKDTNFTPEPGESDVAKGGLLTFNSDWENIDEIRFTGSDGTHILHIAIDELDFEDAVLPSSNSAPTISNATASQTVDDNETLKPFSEVTLADAEGDDINITISLDNNAKGVLSATTIASGTVASVQASLRAITFNPADNRVAVENSETTTFTITANDGTADSTPNTITTVVSTSMNDAPINIALNSTTVAQSGGANATVGTLSTTDADTGETFTYSLVSGSGDSNNGLFNINSTTLRANDSGALSGNYSVRVQTDDGHSGTFAKAFTITVTDDVAPTLSAISSTNVAGTSADILATANESGTMYYVITTSSTAPSNTQVVAGQDNSGASAVKSGNGAVTANTSKTFTVSGLSETTQYYYYMVTVDDTPNKSTVSNGTFTTTDTTAPTVSSVTVPTNGTYKIGGTLSFTVNTSENVDKTGTPRLAIDIGGVTKYATYASGTGSSALVFSYTIEAGLSDSDGIGVGLLELNGGTLKDSSANIMVLTLNNIGATTAVLVDAIKPTLTTVSIVSNNSDTTKAKVGNEITVSFTASEAIATPTATVAGKVATIAGSGNSYTAKYTMVSGDTEGVVLFTINVSDVVGNAGTQVTATTNSSSIMFDKTLPTVTTYSPTDDATGVSTTANLVLTLSENMSAGSGNIIIYDSTDTQIESIPISDAKVTISGTTVTINPSTSLALNTLHYVNIASGALADGAGNAYTGISDTTSWSFTTVADTTAPTISSITIPNSSMKIGSVVTATITVPSETDDYTTGSGAISGTVGGFTLGSLTKTDDTTYTATFTVTEGGTDVASGDDIPVSIKLTDSAGNQMTTAYTTAISQASDPIDANMPTLTTVTIASNNASTAKAKVGDEITVSFTGNESLTANSIVTIAGKSATVVNTSGNIYTAKYTMATGDTTGVVTFAINFSDSIGNAGTQVTATTNSSSIMFDKTAPTGYTVNFTTDPVNSTNKTAVAFSFAGAEVGTTYNYSIDDTDGGTSAVTGTATISTATESVTAIDVSGLNDDTLTLTATLTDPTGNVGAGVTNTVTKDIVSPVITQVTAVVSPTADSTPNYIFSTTEGGTLTMGGSCGSLTSTTVSTGSVTIVLTKTNNSTALDDGTYNNCTVKVTDANGNPSNTLTIPSFTVDTTAPTATFNPANGANHPLDNNITITFSEAIKNSDNSEITNANVGTLITLKKTDASGDSVVFTATIDSAKKVITIDPTDSLIEAQVYYLSYSDVKDSAENVRASENINFTVQPDTTAPTATTFSPEDGNTSTTIDSNLTIIFDETVQAGAGNIVIKYDENDSEVETIAVTGSRVTISNNIVTIDPTNNFAFSTKYYVTIDSGAIKDMALTPNDYVGVSGKGDWDFTTVAKLSLSSLESANITYSEGDGNVSITALTTVLNPSGEDITGAKVKISSNFVSSEDVLHFVNQNGISGGFNSSTGILTLSGTATMIDYQTALRSITYENSNIADPYISNRVLDLNITDSKATSIIVQRSIEITRTNDAPTLNPIANITKNANFSDFNISLMGISDVEMDDLNISFDSNDSTIITLFKNWITPMTTWTYDTSKPINLTVSSEANQSGVTEVTVTVNDGNLTIRREFNITVADTIPDSFSFTPKTNQARSSLIESNSVTLTGMDNNLSISISGVGGEYEINGDGNWTDANSTINSDDNLTLRATTSSSYSTKVTATITVGALSRDFDLTTKANNDPTITIDTNLTTDENQSETMTFSFFDIDGDTVTATVQSDATYGSVTINGTNITYAPDDGYSGNDSFTVEFTDGNGAVIVKTITVVVNPASDTSTDGSDDGLIVVVKSSTVISTIAGSTSVVDANGTTTVTAEIEKSGFIYRAIITIEPDGRTQTRIVKINLATNEEILIDSTIAIEQFHSIGSVITVYVLNGVLEIEIDTPLQNAVGIN